MPIRWGSAPDSESRGDRVAWSPGERPEATIRLPSFLDWLKDFESALDQLPKRFIERGHTG